jgi:hypothetical protein
MRRRLAGNERFNATFDKRGYFTRVLVGFAASVASCGVREKLRFATGSELAECRVRHPG